MKSKIIAVLSAVLILIAFSSCQQVFTTSAYFWVETDFSTLTEDQQVSYAEDLLSSGTTEELLEAYAAIEELLPDDYTTATDLTDEEVELVLLAADLAVGSSGIGDAISGALDAFATGEGLDETLLDDIDTANLESAVSLIEAAEDNGAELSTEQYTNAAAAQMLVVMDDAEALGLTADTLDESDPAQAAIIEDLEQAQAWATAGGIDIESLLAGGVTA